MCLPRIVVFPTFNLLQALEIVCFKDIKEKHKSKGLGYFPYRLNAQPGNIGSGHSDPLFRCILEQWRLLSSTPAGKILLYTSKHKMAQLAK